jgi:hypothetical protein
MKTTALFWCANLFNGRVWLKVRQVKLKKFLEENQPRTVVKLF